MSTSTQAAPRRPADSGRFAPADADRFTPAPDNGQGKVAFYVLMAAVVAGLIALAVALIGI